MLLVGRSEGKRTLGRSKHRWVDKIIRKKESYPRTVRKDKMQ
jgi:hypothetical protein